MMNIFAMAYAALSPSFGPLMVSDLGLLLRPRTAAVHSVSAKIIFLSIAVRVPAIGSGPIMGMGLHGRSGTLFATAGRGTFGNTCS